MSERKNLDKLFQEKFKDFEAAAPEDSWPYIEEKLKEKKKRRVIPLWWKLSGVAAVLLIGLALTQGYLSRVPENTNGIVVRENVTDAKYNSDSTNGAPNRLEKSAGEQNAVATTPNTNVNNGESDAESASQSATTNAVTLSNSKVVVQEKQSEDEKRTAFDKIPPVSKQPNSNQRVYQKDQQLVLNENAAEHNANESSIKNRKVKNSPKSNGETHQNRPLAIGSGNKMKVKSGHLKASKALEKTDPSKSSVHQKSTTEVLGWASDSKIANQAANQTKRGENQALQSPVNDKKADLPIETHQSRLVQNENNKPELKQEKKLDSTAIATAEPNALEKLLNEKENNLVTKEPHINRWQITSSVAPIYFGSTSEGSPIDSSFAGNSKTYKTNMSVRLGVNYAVNKKLTVRAGVSQVTLDYNTNDVLVYAGMQRNPLGNVDTNNQNQFLHFARKSASRSAAATSAASIATNLATDEFASRLNQRMGYIEVPVELSYAVINKKFGLNVIGGVSTLFLNENRITVVSNDGLTTNLGEANNLNKTHFSTNVGLGVRYRFYKAFQANFEPMFKYQINTFSKGDGDFKPYFLGLYTGVSYSF